MAKKKIEEENEEEIEEEMEEENESKSRVSNSFKNAIKSYLDSFAKENEFFAVKYANEKKNIDDCCAYIVGEVQNMQVNGLSDDEVYRLARHYYEEENLKVNPLPSGLKVIVNHTEELSEEEKKVAKEKALKAYEEAERKKLEDEAKKKLEKEAKALEKAMKKEEERKTKFGQISLFDL